VLANLILAIKPANYEAIKKFGYLPNVAGGGVMIVKASFI